MRKKSIICLLALTAIVLSTVASYAEVDYKVKKRFKLESTPLDVKLSVSGRWVYVLTNDGSLRVYSRHGTFTGKMAVGTSFDQIEPGATDEEIYLKSSRQKSIQLLDVTYDHAISVKGSPYKGRIDAPIVIVDYTDFQCPYCARLLPTFNALLKRYPNKIKIVYKNYPLKMHKFARKAAAAAMAAHEKGKFWEFHDELFAHYHNMNDAVIKKIQKKLNLNTPEFETLMNSPKIKRKIQQDILQGQSIGVTSTPTVFVNGRLQKNKRLEGFIETIDNELRQ